MIKIREHDFYLTCINVFDIKRQLIIVMLLISPKIVYGNTDFDSEDENVDGDDDDLEKNNKDSRA